MRKSSCVFNGEVEESHGGRDWLGDLKEKYLSPWLMDTYPFAPLRQVVSKLCSHLAGERAGGSEGQAVREPKLSRHSSCEKRELQIHRLLGRTSWLTLAQSDAPSPTASRKSLYSDVECLSAAQAPGAQWRWSGWAWTELRGPSANPCPRLCANSVPIPAHLCANSGHRCHLCVAFPHLC